MLSKLSSKFERAFPKIDICGFLAKKNISCGTANPVISIHKPESSISKEKYFHDLPKAHGRSE